MLSGLSLKAIPRQSITLSTKTLPVGEILYHLKVLRINLQKHIACEGVRSDFACDYLTILA